jgi:hypothetical protein
LLREAAQAVAAIVEPVGVAIVALAVLLAVALAAIAAIRTALNYFLQREIARDARMTAQDAGALQIVSAPRAAIDARSAV